MEKVDVIFSNEFDSGDIFLTMLWETRETEEHVQR